MELQSILFHPDHQSFLDLDGIRNYFNVLFTGSSNQFPNYESQIFFTDKNLSWQKNDNNKQTSKRTQDLEKLVLIGQKIHENPDS